MFYIISPPEQTEWRLDQDAFARDLLSDWATVRILPTESDSPTRALVWSIEDPQGESNWLEGSLDREGQAHYLRGDIMLAAKYADWLRRKVDLEQPLVFADEAFDHVIPLTDYNSATRIVETYAIS